MIVQPFQGLFTAEPDGAAALSAGEDMPVIDGLQEASVGDGQEFDAVRYCCGGLVEGAPGVGGSRRR